MIDLSQLNSEQLRAVKTISGPLMILAGAGTGKTRVISYRIVHMIASQIQAGNIVALTFTNKAAREMNERVKALIGRKSSGLKIGTFHSFCLSVLRSFPEASELDPKFKIIGTSEQLDLVRRALDEKGWGGLYRADNLLTRISNAKNNLITPNDLITGDFDAKHFHDEDPSLLAKVYSLYERQLKLNRVIDFDDCIFRVVHLLESNAKVLEKLRCTYTHFLVDEFQDTNLSQLKVLEILAGLHKNICVVGDDDQSIYSWRGALFETLERFENFFTGTKLIKLEQNYRCTNIILNAANTVIKNNVGRKDKVLWSTSESQTEIALTAHASDADEARWIAEKCLALLGKGCLHQEIAILYRANNQAKTLEMALREMKLRYKVFGGSSFFEKKEVKDFLAYFKLVLDHGDLLSFWRVINTPARGFGLKTLEQIEAAAQSRQLSPFLILQQDLCQLKGKSKANGLDFIEKILLLAKETISTKEDIERVSKSIIKEFRLEDDIREKVAHPTARQQKIESLRRLPGWLAQIGEDLIEQTGILDVTGLLDKLTICDECRQETSKGDGNYISLMTIHGAKGLEFPAVFVCGLEEDLLPHKNSIGSPIGLAEERRLFYVAITRAKERLHLSYAKERFSGFQRIEKRPSRFLDELPVEGIAKTGVTEIKPSLKKENALKRLTNLKDSLRTGFRS